MYLILLWDGFLLLSWSLLQTLNKYLIIFFGQNDDNKTDERCWKLYL